MDEVARTDRYGSMSIALHWLMLALLVAVYGVIELREFYPRGSALREGLKTWHYMLGLTVFGLVWLRVLARLLAPAPAPVEGGWRLAMSRAVHAALYAFMIGMPVAGWLILSAEGEPIPYFGAELPPLVAANEALAERVEELHELGGTIGYWLIGLHAVAALFHYYILRDGLMARMLPRRPLPNPGELR
jgi:cytochrome b561